jgi:hypothetical protein
MQSEDEILDDEALAIRWKVKGTPEAIKKKFKRLRLLDDDHPRHSVVLPFDLKIVRIKNNSSMKWN